MSEYDELVKKLGTYRTLNDVVNRRKVIDQMIATKPGDIRGWYEKAKLLSGDFIRNQCITTEFKKCANNILKLGGSNHKYYQECLIFVNKVIEKEKQEEKQKSELQQQNEKQKAIKRKYIIGAILGLAVISAIVIYAIIPIASRTTFSSKDEMKQKLQGKYMYHYGFTDKKGEWHETSTDTITIEGDTLIKHYDMGEIDDFKADIKGYHYNRGYISTSLGKYVVTKEGDLKKGDNVYRTLQNDLKWRVRVGAV